MFLALAGTGHLVRAFLNIVDPPLADQLSLFFLTGILGEGGLTVWLLAFGLNAPKWESRALATTAPG